MIPFRRFPLPAAVVAGVVLLESFQMNCRVCLRALEPDEDDLCRRCASLAALVRERVEAVKRSNPLETEFGRRVRTLAGNYQILVSYPALLGPRNRMVFHFVSYKLGRLLLPWLLLMMVVASCFLPAPWRIPTVAAQLAFYALAAMDRLIPAGSLLKKLSSPTHTFAVMMVAWARASAIFGKVVTLPLASASKTGYSNANFGAADAGT
jgi:hypothetical protein